MAVEFEADNMRKISLNDMMDFIEKNYPDDKAWFKKVAVQDANGNDTGKYNHRNAVRQFCGKYAPKVAKKAKSTSATKRLEKW